MSFCELYKDGCLLKIKLTPNAAFCGFKDIVTAADGTVYLKAYVNVVPEKGRANSELIKMLSKRLKIAKSNISIISGATEHYKKIYIAAQAHAAELCALIETLAGEDK